MYSEEFFEKYKHVFKQHTLVRNKFVFAELKKQHIKDYNEDIYEAFKRRLEYKTAFSTLYNMEIGPKNVIKSVSFDV